MYSKILSIVLLLLLAAQPCLATPTGLNNIPTTDVAGDKVLVVQGWTAVGSDTKPLYVTGFKYGALDIVEVGLDSKIGSDDEGPVALQGKFRFFESDAGFSALVGVEGITFEGDIDEDLVPYGVVTQDLKFLRIHAGYNFQKDNFAVFGGVDRAFSVFGQALTFRGDVKQVNDGEDLLASGGFIVTLPFNFALESWLSIPTEDNAEESVVVKLNYIMKF